ncbi:hypothetical protein RR11_1629 [Ruegeria sp. R11]|nr:hypothetical protein RR11_1629 [Ruegeria sp. R11]
MGFPLDQNASGLSGFYRKGKVFPYRNQDFDIMVAMID